MRECDKEVVVGQTECSLISIRIEMTSISPSLGQIRSAKGFDRLLMDSRREISLRAPLLLAAEVRGSRSAVVAIGGKRKLARGGECVV